MFLHNPLYVIVRNVVYAVVHIPVTLWLVFLLAAGGGVAWHFRDPGFVEKTHLRTLEELDKIYTRLGVTPVQRLDAAPEVRVQRRVIEHNSAETKLVPDTQKSVTVTPDNVDMDVGAGGAISYFGQNGFICFVSREVARTRESMMCLKTRGYRYVKVRYDHDRNVIEEI